MKDAGSTKRDTHASHYSRTSTADFAEGSVRSLSALVVGGGALGNEVVKAAGLLGFGKVAISDADVVEPSNLTRSVLFRTADAVGRNKAVALADSASILFPATKFLSLPVEIADVGFGQIAEADIIFSCVDSDLARLEIAYISTKLNIPVSDGGLGTDDYSHGRVSFFPGIQGGCYGCLIPARTRCQLLTTWDSSVGSCWHMSSVGTPNGYSTTPTMSAIVGSMQVELGLRRLFELRNAGPIEAGGIELCLDSAPSLEVLRLLVSPSCPFHSHMHSAVLKREWSPELRICEWLGREAAVLNREPTLILDWPICLSALCLACGSTWEPLMRLGAFRKRGACPMCGSRQIKGTEILRSIDRQSPLSRFKTADLGLPPRHLHTIAFGTLSL